MPLTYRAMALYTDIKAMALYLNETFEKNLGKNRVVKAKVYLLKSGKRKHASYGQRMGNGCLEVCFNG